MSDAWIVVAVVGVATIAFKAAGPVVIGRRVAARRMCSLSSSCSRRSCSSHSS